MPVSILPMTLEVMMKKIFPGILEKESSTAPVAIRANSSLPGTQVGRKQVHQLVCRHHAHRAIWVPADSAKWPCRSIGSICWGQPSEYGTSKQLSTLRFTGQWLRGRDKANLGWINFETENISFLGPIWPLGAWVNHLTHCSSVLLFPAQRVMVYFYLVAFKGIDSYISS